MKLETKLLKPVITSAVKLAAKRTTLPILNHLLLDGSNGALDVSATDIDVFHSASVEKKSGQLPPVCIPARSFHALIEGAGEFVTLEADKDKLVVSSDSWTRRMSTLPVAEYPQHPDVKGMKQLAVPAHLMASAIKSVAWAGVEATKDNRRFTETILIEMGAKSLKTTAFRGTVFAQSSQNLICSDLTWMLPVKSAAMFCDALMGEDVQLLHSDKRIVVIHSTGFFSSALPVDPWPKYQPIFEGERISLGASMVGPLLACLERAVTVYPIDYAPVTIKVENGKWVFSTDPGQDTYTETLKPDKGNTAKRLIRLNATLLIDALKAFEPDSMPLFSMNPSEIKTGGLFLELGDLLFLVARLNDKP